MMIMQVTEAKTMTFDARALTPQDEGAVLALAGSGKSPLIPSYQMMLRHGWVWGDYAGLPSLQAVTALLPLYSQAPLSLSLRAAGYGADGQGAVLTPLHLADGYCQIRHFLRLALRWGQQRYAPYHMWAVLPYSGSAAPTGLEELCAQYLACGLTLRALCPVPGGESMLVFSARPLPRWEEPIKKLHLKDPALPRMLEHGYAAADFGWDRKGMLLLLRPTTY